MIFDGWIYVFDGILSGYSEFLMDRSIKCLTNGYQLVQYHHSLDIPYLMVDVF